MKNKILTLSLGLTMIFSLAACGSKTDEPKSSADTSVSGQEEAKQTAEAETAKSEEEPEQVKLTADTIDKYFGFKYTDVADDAITGFTLKVNQAYGTETLNVAHVPMKYSESGCPLINELADRINKSTLPTSAPFGLYFQPFTKLATDEKNCPRLYTWGNDYTYSTRPVNMDGNWAGDSGTYSHETPEWKWATSNSLASIHLYTLNDQDIKDILYAMMQPKSFMSALTQDTQSKLLITNYASDFARVEDCEITGFITSFASDKVNVTIADNITSESTIKDIVAQYAPSKGTIADDGSVTLTWNTASGTTTEITFSANEYKPTSVRILTPDMTPKIISGVNS